MALHLSRRKKPKKITRLKLPTGKSNIPRSKGTGPAPTISGESSGLTSTRDPRSGSTDVTHAGDVIGSGGNLVTKKEKPLKGIQVFTKKKR